MLFSGADSRLVLSFRLLVCAACLSSATAASSSSLFLYVNHGIGGGRSFVYLKEQR